MLCISLWLDSALLTSGPAHAQEAIERIPMEFADGLIIIPVHVNGREDPLDFMFDTGAGVTAIDAGVSEEMALITSGSARIGTASRSLKVQESLSNTLRLGNRFILDSISLFVMDLRHLSEHLKTDIDGIIGFDLLDKVVVETNMDRREMVLFTEEGHSYRGLGVPLELTELESNHFGIPVTIRTKGEQASREVILKMDTGADNHITFHKDAVDGYGLLDKKKRHKVREGFGVDATITRNLRGRISRASLASKEWKNVPVIYEVDPLNHIAERKGDGLIGQELLRDFNITYKLAEGVVYFERR